MLLLLAKFNIDVHANRIGITCNDGNKISPVIADVLRLCEYVCIVKRIIAIVGLLRAAQFLHR
ncbi:hypothetical protein D3C76_1486530 [compost metagenome]